jgi:hypothetical protein
MPAGDQPAPFVHDRALQPQFCERRELEPALRVEILDDANQRFEGCTPKVVPPHLRNAPGMTPGQPLDQSHPLDQKFIARRARAFDTSMERQQIRLSGCGPSAPQEPVIQFKFVTELMLNAAE